jgi:hypothetical protein
MNWKHVPTEGTAGGILVGFKNKSIEVLSWQICKYCVSAIVRSIDNKFTWRLVVVYGLAYDDHKVDFLTELEMVMNTWQGPTLVGGDFNLVRTQNEKSNKIVIFSHTMAFNEWIHRWGLIEYKDPIRIFT